MKAMKTPPPSPPRKSGGEDARKEATPQHSPPAAAEAKKSGSRGGTPGTVDLTPVIRNGSYSPWAEDGRPGGGVLPGVPSGLVLGGVIDDSDDDEVFMLASRGLRQRTSNLRLSSEGAGNSLSTAGTSLSGETSDMSRSSGREGRWGGLLTGGRAPGGGGAGFERAEDGPAGLAAPVELAPDRKFCSFQGEGQYRRLVAKSSSKMETVPSSPRGTPERPPQYQPPERNQHGVEELADARDLDAIFKSPRRKGPRLVSPDRPAPDDDDDDGARDPPRMPHQPSQQQPQQQQHQAAHLLSRPYPVDERDWSIPSIRLANHVDQTSSSGDRLYSFASAADLSECTVEDDVDLFLDGSWHSRGGGPGPAAADDDDSSLDMSAGSWSRRRRRSASAAGIFQRKGSSSSGGGGSLAAMADRIPQTVFSQDVGDAVLPPGPSSLPVEPAPAITVLRPSQKSEVPPRARRREGAAAAREWLRDLQDRSREGGSAAPIAEAASSKFLRPPAAAAAGNDGAAAPPSSSSPGTPRPLCRSSTIGAGA